MTNYKSVFGFTKEPFTQEIRTEELYMTGGLKAATERFLFAISIGAVSVITGEVGAGKSTALRYGVSKLHPSLYRVITVVASTGSCLEILRQICMGLDVECKSLSIAVLLKTIRGIITEIAQKKQIPVLVIDEAQLMRLEVFAQLHTLGQFEMDSKPILPIILSGQNNLIDKLMYYTSKPLSSRVVGRSHLEGLKSKDMSEYLKHHLEIAGIREQLFSDEAILAIHQGSGGLLRRANILAKTSLIAAATEKCHMVSAEHVRIASSEII
ncbi:MAG: AAA family ATPase [Nitrospinae bacterium]|nr:AAA family ATPase [Nitrospinota bacterium]